MAGGRVKTKRYSVYELCNVGERPNTLRYVIEGCGGGGGQRDEKFALRNLCILQNNPIIYLFEFV